jgi:hypothetical protein
MALSVIAIIISVVTAALLIGHILAFRLSQSYRDAMSGVVKK